MDKNMTLEKRIAAELYCYQGKMSVFVDDLQGHTVEVGADEEFETASTIKAFILAALYLQAQRGKADLAEEITYEQGQFVDGSGMLRALGVVLVCGGLRSMLGILEALAKIIPLLGTIVGAGISFIAIVIGLAWSLIWIAVGWVYYRPVVGIPLIIAAIALVVWSVKRAAERKASVKAESLA